MLRSTIAAALFALLLALPAMAETLSMNACGTKASADATAITSATGDVDVVLCDHGSLEIRVQVTGGTSADYAVQTCAYVSGTLACDALSPAISRTVAAGSRDVVFIDRSLERVRVAITGNDGSVAVRVTGHPH